MSTEATAYVVGWTALGFPHDAEEIDLTPDMRKEIKLSLLKYAHLASEQITIHHRWMIESAETVSGKDLRNAACARLERTPFRFQDLVAMLRGFFSSKKDEAIWSVDHMKTVVRWMDAIQDGMPVRYQKLFFEVGEAIAKERTDLDLRGLCVAVDVGKHDFPPVRSLPQKQKKKGAGRPDEAKEDGKEHPSKAKTGDPDKEEDTSGAQSRT